MTGLPPNRCVQCGLAAPTPPLGTLAFCCSGCRTVFELLADPSLAPAAASGRSYAELDDVAFITEVGTPLPGGLVSLEVYLEGVHCAACVFVTEKVPQLVPQAREVRLDLARQVATVVWSPAVGPLSDIARMLERLGYRVRPLRGTSARELRRVEDRRALLRLGIAGAIAGNVMLLAFALYSGAFADMEHGDREFFRWLSAGLSVPAVCVAGVTFFRGAWASLATKTPHMDLPIASGLFAGLVGGLVNTVRGTGEVYFDSVCVLVFLLLAGRRLQQVRQRKASDAAELLASVTPGAARRVRLDGGVRRIEEVPLERLAPGDCVEVRPTDPVPADGTVLTGSSELDVSLLTGESRPVPVGPGAAVYAGTLNRSRTLEVQVDRVGDDTRVGRLLRELATAPKAPVVRLADRLVTRFVVIVLTLAAVTAGVWLVVDASQALDHVMALLVVTCPCALALATPLAVSVAIGRAARAGLLIKGGDPFEALAKPRGLRVFLDKTGTLTEGRLRVEQVVGDASLGPVVSRLECDATHPVGRALAEAFTPAEGSLTDVEHTIGGGVSGRVAGLGTVRVGKPDWVTPEWRRHALAGPLNDAIALGRTPVLVSVDGDPRAGVALGDPLREDTRATLDALRAAGVALGVLSGDHPEVVAHVARTLGLEPTDCHGGLSPEDKRARIQDAVAAGGVVVMVGDGVNDAAALRAATVGVAVHGGAEASLHAADVFTTTPGLTPVLTLTRAAGHTLRVIRRNYVFSVAYNVVGAGLAMAGLLSPLVAAVLMPLSSVTVISSSLLGATFRKEAS